MQRGSRESETNDDFGSNDRSLDLVAWEAEYLSDDAQRSAQPRARSSLENLPMLNDREPQYAPPEDGPNDNCDPAELSTFGLGPQLFAPSATTVFTQNQALVADGNFTSLFDFDGSVSDMAHSATTAMPSNASEDIIMDTPDRGSILPTTLMVESNHLPASARDHFDPIMGECRNLLDDDPNIYARSYGNVPPHVVQCSSYPNHPTMMPVQATESGISTLTVRERSVPDVSHNTLHPTSTNLASQPIAPSQSTETGSTQSLMNVRFPPPGHAPILPKEPVTSHSIATLSTRNAQDIYSSSELSLVPYGEPLATKSAQKRPRSPQLHDNFPFIHCKYDSGMNATVEQAIPSGWLSNKRLKRTRNRKACLQCQFMQKKVMFTLPQSSGAQTDVSLVLRNLPLRTLSRRLQYRLSTEDARVHSVSRL